MGLDDADGGRDVYADGYRSGGVDLLLLCHRDVAAEKHRYVELVHKIRQLFRQHAGLRTRDGRQDDRGGTTWRRGS